MARRKKGLTQAQIEWRQSILKGRINSVKKAAAPVERVLTDEDKINQCFYYLDNCVFWANEYIDGRVDKIKLLSVAKYLQENGRSLELILRKLSTVSSSKK